jgi:hypothetical protein
VGEPEPNRPSLRLLHISQPHGLYHLDRFILNRAAPAVARANVAPKL